MSVLLLLLLWAVCGTVEGTTLCLKLFPAVSNMAMGVDLSTLDIFGPNTQLVNPVLQFTCNKGQKQAIGDVEYDVPDQVMVPIATTPGSVTTFFKISAGSTQAFKLQFAASMHVDLFFGLASQTQTIKGMYSSMLQQSAEAFFLSSYVSGFSPILHYPWPWSHDSAKLNDDAQGYVDNVLINATQLNDTNVDQFNEFIASYGTHVGAQTCQGGAMHAEYMTGRSYVEQAGALYAQKQADASFLGFVKASGGYSGDVAAVDAQWLAATAGMDTSLGGRGIPGPTPDSFNAWAQSVLVYPHILPCTASSSRKLRQQEMNQNSAPYLPLSLWFPKHLKTAFDQAIQNYYDHVYLQAEAGARINGYIRILNQTLLAGDTNCPWQPNCDGPCGAPCGCWRDDTAAYQRLVARIFAARDALTGQLTASLQQVQQFLAMPVIDHTALLVFLGQLEIIGEQLETPWASSSCQNGATNSGGFCVPPLPCALGPWAILPGPFVPSTITYPSGLKF